MFWKFSDFFTKDVVFTLVVEVRRSVRIARWAEDNDYVLKKIPIECRLFALRIGYCNWISEQSLSAAAWSHIYFFGGRRNLIHWASVRKLHTSVIICAMRCQRPAEVLKARAHKHDTVTYMRLLKRVLFQPTPHWPHQNTSQNLQDLFVTFDALIDTMRTNKIL